MMDYLDYLPDTPYKQLPDSIKATISAKDYEDKRSVALGMMSSAATTPVLPEVLRQAYANRQSVNPAVDQSSIVTRHRTDSRNYKSAFRWVAAACVLLLATSLTLLLRQPKNKLIYKIVSTEVPPPTIIHDTIYQEKLVDKFIYRTRRDTLVQYLPGEPKFVYQTDTLYLPTLTAENDEVVFVKSKTAADEVRLLDLLVPTR